MGWSKNDNNKTGFLARLRTHVPGVIPFAPSVTYDRLVKAVEVGQKSDRNLSVQRQDTMEGRLECNKCKKILGGNCFLTKCRHIFCHGDGLSAYNDNGTFTCPVCNAVLDQQTGITELKFAR